MPATLHGMQAAGRARAAANSIIGSLGENLTLMRAITTSRKSILSAPDAGDSQAKQDLDSFDFANQREDQQTALMPPEIVKGVRSKIKDALEALDDAGVTFELPESVTSQMILMREQDIPANSVLQWYDWQVAHAAPNKLLLDKITDNSDIWDEYVAGYTSEQITTALDNITNNFFSVFRSMQPLLTAYDIMKRVNMYIIDKDAVNDPPVAMFYYAVPWEEADTPVYNLIDEDGNDLVDENGTTLITEGEG